MDGTEKAFLLIADISGFTGFMRQKSISLNHAKQIVVRLLKSVINASEIPLKVAEIEGDAVFFTAVVEGDPAQAALKLREKINDFFEAFRTERDSIEELRTCSCNACVQVGSLRLKQVLHFGEVARETIGSFEKFFGPDVILVHRMLKNSVGAKEYVMMTIPAFAVTGGIEGSHQERRTEEFEGMGKIETVVFTRTEDPRAHRTAESTQLRKLGWRWLISWRYLTDWLGIGRIRGDFRNLEEKPQRR